VTWPSRIADGPGPAAGRAAGAGAAPCPHARPWRGGRDLAGGLPPAGLTRAGCTVAGLGARRPMNPG